MCVALAVRVLVCCNIPSPTESQRHAYYDEVTILWGEVCFASMDIYHVTCPMERKVISSTQRKSRSL